MSRFSETYSKVIVYDFCEKDKKIWSALGDKNGICEIDTLTGKVKLIGIFPGEELMKSSLYYEIEKSGNYLVFSPGLADKIAIFSLEDNSVKYIPLQMPKQGKKEGIAKFLGKFSYKENVYLLGYTVPVILKVNAKTLEVTYIDGWAAHIHNKENFRGFQTGCVIYNETAMIPITGTHRLLELNLVTSQTKIIEPELPVRELQGITAIDEENIWMVGSDEKRNLIMCWNKMEHIVRTLEFANRDEIRHPLFYPPLCTEDKVYFMPILAAHMYEMDKKTGKVSVLEALEKEIKGVKTKKGISVIAPRINGTILKFITANDFRWYEYDFAAGTCHSYFLYFEDKMQLMPYFDEILLHKMKNRELIQEMEIPLECFMDTLKNVGSAAEGSGINSCGHKIYRAVSWNL